MGVWVNHPLTTNGKLTRSNYESGDRIGKTDKVCLVRERDGLESESLNNGGIQVH